MGPGVDAERAALMISSTSFRLGSLKLNSVVGGAGLMRALLGSRSCSLRKSLTVSRRKRFTSSLEHSSRPLRLSPSSCFVKPKGLAMKIAHFMARSLPLLRCHSALRRIISFFRKMFCSSANGRISSSVAFLYCLLRVQSS